MEIRKVLIIGLGLIGGSIAKSFKNRLGLIIAVYDVNREYVQKALEEGTADSFIDITDKDSLGNNLQDVNLIVVCTPSSITCDIIAGIHSYINSDTIVSDVCSTKATIVSTIKSKFPHLNFIGGHPMAGSERSGYNAASDNLFENAYYVLTPIDNNFASQKAMNAMTKLADGIGAIPLIMSPEIHDYSAAAISHAPHVLAFALVNMIRELDFKLDSSKSYMHTMAAGGFKDLTRIASSDAVMWESICRTNKDNIILILNTLCEHLKTICQKIDNRETSALIAEFSKAKNYRDSFNKTSIGLIKPVYMLKVDVHDRIGTIAKISSILAKNNINIKNLNIENSREMEGGCLVLYFENLEQYETASSLLEAEGILN